MPFSRVLPAASLPLSLEHEIGTASIKSFFFFFPPPFFVPYLFIYLGKREEWYASDARSLGSTEGYLGIEGERRS